MLSVAFSATAQTAMVLPDWEAKPIMHSIPDTFAKEQAVIIEEHSKIDFRDEGDTLWMYRTLHRIVKVLGEEGIESFNKVTIPTYDGREIQVLKARTILPNGKIFEVAKDKMKLSKGEDGTSEIAIAMEGVEKGAEIELLFCNKKHYRVWGAENFQFSVPVLHASFSLTSPSRLTYEEKGYNNFPTASDTLIDKIRYITAERSMIPAMKKEIYSHEEANRARAEYKLSYLPDEQQYVRQYTWKDLAKRIYGNSYNLSDRERSAAAKYVESIGVQSTDNEADKIKKIEGAIKSSITYYKSIDDDEAEHIDRIIAKKSATELGLLRLYAACFTITGVKHELGVTFDRYDNAFDKDFENWDNMDYYLFYFPNLKNFLYPVGTYIRYPFLPSAFLTNKGVFLKLTTLGDVTNALADIRTIEPRPVTESHIDIISGISFTPDMDAKADVTYAFAGYAAVSVREAAVLLPQDKVKELVENIVNIADKPENIVKYEMANTAFENYYDNKPFEIIASVKVPQLVEKAGDKYLFKLGDVIGRQSELYQTTERTSPIDLDYPHHLDRTITITIPDGYKVLNPETIVIHADCKDEEGNTAAGFSSDYKIEGNKLTVTIIEFYAALHLPVSAYEPFRKVINASADFNKVNLLLAKQ